MTATQAKTYTLRQLKAIAARHGGDWQRAYERALAWVADGNTDHEWWDTTVDEWQRVLEAIGFDNAEIRFSGFGCQGDGACFTAGINQTRLIDFFTHEKPPWPESCLSWDWLIKTLGGKYTDPNLDVLHHLDLYGGVRGNDSRYSHTQCATLDLDHDGFPDDMHELGQALCEEAFDIFKEQVESLRVDLCRAIYNALEQDYDYLNSEAACLEAADSNDWRFDADGELE